MSGEALALETQLLLQEVTQAKPFEVAVVAGDEALPPVSEFEAAKLSLVEKLRKKKELNRQQQQELNAKRYGIKPTVAATAAQRQSQQTVNDRLTPTKAKRMAAKLPVGATGHAGSRQKKDLLSKLKSQAIQQGAQEMAKLFGYKSYEDQIKHLNEIEQKKLLESARKETEDKVKEAEKAKVEELDKDDEDSSSDFVDEGVEAPEAEQDERVPTDEAVVVTESTSETVDAVAGDEAMEQAEPYEETQDLDALEAQEAATRGASVSPSVLSTARKVVAEGGAEVVRRRRNQIPLDDEDNDGNEADSEEDGKDEADDEQEEDEKADKTPRDKAAAFRQLLQAEAAQNRKRKRLRKGGADFVDDEAEEDEEEDVLKIGGLGDFGFGVPQAASKESKEAEEERMALKLREDDLEGIVDDLSDDERAQEQDLEELHRKELEDLDRQQVKEVMRNVKEGFGRNRRAFSNLEGGSAARGRFNLNDLVAADGDKTEAARLGLLESDEDMNDDDEDEEADGSKKNEEEEEEEDEEAEMERKLRERYQSRPKIYITSSESENEDENEVEDQDDEAVKEEIESDEERERQQMKLFSERARINRRMQRMKDMQRQIAEESEEPASKAPLPNILLEEDEDSQSLLKVLNRTDVSKAPENSAVPSKDNKTAAARPKGPTAASGNRPKIGRFNSFGMGSSVSRSTSSFSRVVDNCKLFSAGSTAASSAKGFVFTSFSSDKAERADENAAPGGVDSGLADAAPATASLVKSKSWGGSSAASRATKRPLAASNGATGATGGASKKRKSDFFSVLASYQCVSQSTDQ